VWREAVKRRVTKRPYLFARAKEKVCRSTGSERKSKWVSEWVTHLIRGGARCMWWRRFIMRRAGRQRMTTTWATYRRRFLLGVEHGQITAVVADGTTPTATSPATHKPVTTQRRACVGTRRAGNMRWAVFVLCLYSFAPAKLRRLITNEIDGRRVQFMNSDNRQ